MLPVHPQLASGSSSAQWLNARLPSARIAAGDGSKLLADEPSEEEDDEEEKEEEEEEEGEEEAPPMSSSGPRPTSI